MSRAQPFRVAVEQRQTSYPGHSGYARVQHDYYREPAAAVDALLEYETFTGRVFDPCCGGGTIPARCRAHGIQADGSDLQAIAGCAVADFFASTAMHDNIITNPPYRPAVRVIRHALQSIRYKAAFLLRLSFMESQGRRAAFKSDLRPAGVLVLSKRPSCPPGIYEGLRDNLGCLVQPEETGGKMPYAWFIFERGYSGRTWLDWP